MEDKNNEIEDLKKRVQKLESQMIFLHRRLGIELDEKPQWHISEKVLSLVRQGKKTEAIKAFVQETGASLKDAKQFIENIK